MFRWCSFDFARKRIHHLIDDTIMEYYPNWNKKSKKQKRDIIEDIVYSKAPYYGLTKSEIEEIIKEEMKHG